METLEQLLKETDALTYINSLKVTLTEIKDEVSKIEEMQEYQNQACQRVKKLMRKADNQYRLVAKLISRDAPFATHATMEEDLKYSELERLMEENE